jgi:PKD repeat protein
MRSFITCIALLCSYGMCFSQAGFSHLFKKPAPFAVATNSQTVFLQNVDSGYYSFCHVIDTPNTTNILTSFYNESGQLKWQKEVNLPYYIERLRDAVLLTDSNIMLLCTYDEPGLIYDEEVYLIKLNLVGEIISTYFVTNTGICCWDIASGRLQLNNAGKLLLTHQSFGISTANGLVRVLDTNFVYLQGATDPNALYHANFFQDTDSNYMSFAYESLSQLKRASFIKRNKNFTYVWQKHFKHPAIASNKLTIARDAKRIDNHYVLLTNFEDTNGYNNVWIIKTDLNGDTLYTQRFINHAQAIGIEKHNNNTYVLATNPTDSSGKYFIKLELLDSAFALQTEHNYRYKNFSEIITSFKRDADGSYLIGARADSSLVPYTHVLKVAPDFCIEPKALFSVGYNTGLLPTQSGVVIYNNSDAGVWDANTTITINMGDGNTLPLPVDSLIYVYAQQGTYMITVTISTVCGTSTFSQPVTVACTGQPQFFSISNNELQAQFNYAGTQPSYNWTFGDGTTSTLQNPIHVYANAGTYYVCLSTTNTCGPIVLCDSVVINCMPINIPVNATYNACMGVPILLDAGNSGSAYLWSDGSSFQTLQVAAAGTYTVTVTNACGTSAMASTNIVYSSAPVIDIGSDSVVCLFDNTAIQNISGLVYNYSWYVDGIYQGLGNVFYFSQSNLGVYNITLVANNNGCLDSVSKNLTLSPTVICDSTNYCIPVYTFGTDSNNYIKQFVCGSINNITGGVGLSAYNDYSNLSTTVTTGQNITLQFDINETIPMSYGVWIDYNQDGDFIDFGELISSGNVNSGLTTALATISNDAYGGPTRLRIRCSSNTVTNSCSNYLHGETEDYTILINNGTGAPVVSFVADTLHIYPGDAVNFYDLSYNNPTDWKWTFTGAQTTTSSLKNPVNIIYSAAGCYPVVLQASNAMGSGFKVDTCYIMVDVTLSDVEASLTDANIWPNPFVDQVYIYKPDNKNATVSIYDISGACVFSDVLNYNYTTIPTHRWAQGVYHVSIIMHDGKIIVKRVIK